MDIENLDFDKGNGLIPAVIQDADSYRVLMLGYMNREALEKTLKDERITFFSRSKERLWTKGETSGNTLRLVDLQSDCDNDTLLVLAEPSGPVCHTGEECCFFEKEFKPVDREDNFLNRLEEIIYDRKEKRPEGSYTRTLFDGGIDKITQKVGEEAIETLIDAKNDDNDRLVDEVSDLVYHLMVLLAQKEIPLQQVIDRLEERHVGN